MQLDNGAQARRLTDVWFEMYQLSVLRYPELAAELEQLITGSDVVPDTETVRSYLSAVVRGALSTRPSTSLFGRLFR